MLAGLSASDVDSKFKVFWEAKNTQEAAKLAPDIVNSGVTFEEAFKHLKTGRPYFGERRKGRGQGQLSGARARFLLCLIFRLNHSAHRYQVRFQLHGGVVRPSNQPRGDGTIGVFARAEQIYVMPYAWADAPWWSEAQIREPETILTR